MADLWMLVPTVLMILCIKWVLRIFVKFLTHQEK